MTTRHRPQSALGRRLLALRNRADMTQRQLARKAHLSQGIVQSIEQGVRTNPTMLTLLRLANALQVSVSELINGLEAEYLLSEVDPL